MTEKHELEHEKEKWELISASTAGDLKIKADKLEEIDAELDTIRKEIDTGSSYTKENMDYAATARNQKKDSRAIAQMAVRRLIGPNEWSEEVEDYQDRLHHRLSGVDQVAAYEWCRYYDLKKELKKIEKDAQTSEWLQKRKRLLKKEIDAITSWATDERDTPTTGNPEITENYPSPFFEFNKSQSGKTEKEKPVENEGYTSNELNYFIRRSDNWRVRFNGGEETDIKNKKGVRALVEFLSKPNKEFDCADLYQRLHGEGNNDITMENDNQREHTTSDQKYCEVMDDKGRKALEEEMKRLSQELEEAVLKGDENKTKELEDKFATRIKVLRTQYNAIVNEDDGSIDFRHCQFKDERTKNAENLTKQIDRLIKHFEEIEDLSGLSEHLTDYLRRNYQKGKMRYTPPPNFPDWEITT